MHIIRNLRKVKVLIADSLISWIAAILRIEKLLKYIL